ncbi:TniB family NTP-binding protein [Pseudomonas nicosulfuronedens]
MASIASLMMRTLSPEDAGRVRNVQKDVWIGYERAQQIRGQMESLLQYPDSHRMPCMALIGSSNNGKSMILMNFLKHHSRPIDPNAEKATVPVVMIETPANASEGRLYNKILERFKTGGSAREPDDAKLRRVKIILEAMETKMLIVDDIFNVNGSAHTQRRRFLNALRNLTTELRIPIVISGTEETENIISVDKSIVNRFKPVFLPCWGEDRLEEYARFVMTIEQRMALAGECGLIDERSLMRLMYLTDGLLGETVDLLKILGELAIRSGEEAITAKHLSQERLDAINWVRPSDRGRRR